MTYGFHRDRTVSVCVWFSVTDTELSWGNPAPSWDLSAQATSCDTVACQPSISPGDITPLLITQVFHGLPGLTWNLHHF